MGAFASTEMNSIASEKLNFGKNDGLGVRGRFGTVYKGKLNGKLDVAIKQVEKARTKVAESDFYYYTNGHQNILNFFCVVASDSKFVYFVTELCAGNLEDLVLTNFLSPLIDIIPEEMLYQILKGVHHLHLLKIVHGDLKPTNILVSCPKGDLGSVFKVADFGLCHHTKEYGGNEQRFIPAHTEGWFCPFDPIDEKGQRSLPFDIFSLALLFGFVASKGVHPLGRTFEEAIKRIRNKYKMMLTLEKIDESIRRVSFLDLLNQMLSYEDSKRPTTSQILDHPFFKIHFVISVQQQEEEQVPYMETLMLSPTTAKRSAPTNILRPASDDFIDEALVQQETGDNRLSRKRQRKTKNSRQQQMRKLSDDEVAVSKQKRPSSRRLSAKGSHPSNNNYTGSAGNQSEKSGTDISGSVGVDEAESLTSSLPTQKQTLASEGRSRRRLPVRPTANSANEESSTAAPSYQSPAPPSSPSSSEKGNSTGNGSGDTETRKQFHCSECGNRFTRKDHLKMHMKIHTGDRPFKCKSCEKTFITVQQLRYHTFTHTGEKPFLCNHCSRGFAHPSDLRKHSKLHS